jgi:DNA-binding MarR family transcriptional regulator
MLKEDQSQKLADMLVFLFRALHRGLESQPMKDGHTVPQRIVLGQLARHGQGGLSVKELSRKMGLSHSTISGIVDRLERKGLVKRIQDQQDRRITKVTITGLASGHFHKMLSQQMFSGIVEAFRNAPAGEQEKIMEGLAALKKLLDQENNGE